VLFIVLRHNFRQERLEADSQAIHVSKVDPVLAEQIPDGGYRKKSMNKLFVALTADERCKGAPANICSFINGNSTTALEIPSLPHS
jgi:hypothetical protein